MIYNQKFLQYVLRGQKVSPTNRGNKNNSYRETRTDKRAKWFKAAYKCLERTPLEIISNTNIIRKFFTIII